MQIMKNEQMLQNTEKIKDISMYAQNIFETALRTHFN